MLTMLFFARPVCMLILLTVAIFSLAPAPTTSASHITQIIDANGDGTGNTLSAAFGVAVDSQTGIVYVSGRDSKNVFSITTGGGIGQIINQAAGGVGINLSSPRGVASGPSDAPVAADDVYVVAYNTDKAFRRQPTGRTDQIIGPSGDLAGKILNGPLDVAAASNGDVYVTGYISDNVFRITRAGVITEIIDGTGDGIGNTLNGPHAVTVDSSNNVYVTGEISGNAFRITPGGTITEIIDPTGDGLGNVLGGPRGIAVHSSGDVYITGYYSDNVFRITPGGSITEIVDATGAGFGGTLNGPLGIAVGSSGNVYVAGWFSHNALLVTPSGTIEEIIDATGDGSVETYLAAPSGIAVDANGDVYVAGTLSHNVFRISSPVCGNALNEALEACDDGGTLPDDGCDASCQVETGWECAGEPSECAEIVAAPGLGLYGFALLCAFMAASAYRTIRA